MHKLSQKTIEKRRREAQEAKNARESFVAEVKEISARRKFMFEEIAKRDAGGTYDEAGLAKAFEAEAQLDPDEVNEMMRVAGNQIAMQLASFVKPQKPKPQPGSPAAKTAFRQALADVTKKQDIAMGRREPDPVQK